MDSQRLADSLFNGHPGIQGAERVLENHLKLSPASAQGGPTQLSEVFPIEEHLAGGRFLELNDGAS
jgi:hypothetical protein